jgi:hypothetical protein
MRESALSLVVETPGLAEVPYCRESNRERGLVPHVTVLYPWLPAPLSPDDIGVAAAVVAGTGPLHVRFEHLETFPAGVVYAAVSDPGPVVDLMVKVWAAFPTTPPYGGAYREPVPHLTLGRCQPSELDATLDEVRAHTAELLPIEVHLVECGVLEQASDGRWSVTGRLSLT